MLAGFIITLFDITDITYFLWRLHATQMRALLAVDRRITDLRKECKQYKINIETSNITKK